MITYGAYQNKNEVFADVVVVDTDALIDVLNKAKENGDTQIILCGSVVGMSDNKRIVDLDPL
ncbi:hypothetical protein D3C80_1894400 [compost metagenome]